MENQNEYDLMIESLNDFYKGIFDTIKILKSYDLNENGVNNIYSTIPQIIMNTYNDIYKYDADKNINEAEDIIEKYTPITESIIKINLQSFLSSKMNASDSSLKPLTQTFLSNKMKMTKNYLKSFKLIFNEY